MLLLEKRKGPLTLRIPSCQKSSIEKSLVELFMDGETFLHLRTI